MFRGSVTFHWFTYLYSLQEMEHELRKAASKGDLPKVRSLVKQGYAQNKVNYTCTHTVAVKQGTLQQESDSFTFTFLVSCVVYNELCF